MICSASRVAEAAQFVLARTSLRPRVGLVLGSGLAGLFGAACDHEPLPYAVIPYFPQPTVPGHPGELVLCRIAGQPVAVLRGRVHLYEGYTPAEVAMPVRLLRALGCSALIVTNAAGGLNPAFAPGDLMLIRDHIFLPGMAGASPLFGEHEPELGTRFVPLATAYDEELCQLALDVAHDGGLPLHEGVYVMVAGPHYETPAELRLLRLLGGDAVGMSTCPEVIAAQQGSLRVLGISAITNLALGDRHHSLSHQAVLEGAAAAEPHLVSLLAGVLQRLGR